MTHDAWLLVHTCGVPFAVAASSDSVFLFLCSIRNVAHPQPHNCFSLLRERLPLTFAVQVDSLRVLRSVSAQAEYSCARARSEDFAQPSTWRLCVRRAASPSRFVKGGLVWLGVVTKEAMVTPQPWLCLSLLLYCGGSTTFCTVEGSTNALDIDTQSQSECQYPHRHRYPAIKSANDALSRPPTHVSPNERLCTRLGGYM